MHQAFAFSRVAWCKRHQPNTLYIFKAKLLGWEFFQQARYNAEKELSLSPIVPIVFPRTYEIETSVAYSDACCQ